MTIYQGLDLNGIRDITAELSNDPVVAPQLNASPTPPCIILDGDSTAPSMAGQHAKDSIAGRGWTYPSIAAATNKNDSDRIPLVTVLREARNDAEHIETKNGRARTSTLLKAHFSDQLERTSRDHSVIAIEDDSTEDYQQTIIDAAISAGRRSNLLWRPVAALLGWGGDRSEPELNQLTGKLAIVIHLGYRTAEVSILSLDTTEHNGTRYLVPQRHNTGQAAENWNGGKFWQRLNQAEVERISPETTDNHQSLTWQLSFGTSRLWNLILGRPPEEVLVQRSDGIWLLDSPPPNNPSPFANNDPLVAESVSSIHQALQSQMALEAFEGAAVGCILVEGELSQLPLQTRSLGEEVARQMVAWLEGKADPIVDIIDNQSGIVAIGCANYAYRIANEIESYYDFLPQIEINVRRGRNFLFEPLVKGRKRIAGGETYGPESVEGFAVQIGLKEIDFYLHREGEESTKVAIVTIPNPPKTEVPVELEVTQKPGQGHAVVKVITDPPRILGHKTILLNWRAMTDSEKTKQEVIKEFEAARSTLEYPDCVNVKCQGATWQYRNLPRKLADFIRTPIPDEKNGQLHSRKGLLHFSDSYRQVIDDLFDFNRGIRSRDPYHSPINSDGLIPADLDVHCHLPEGYGTFEDLFDKFLSAADEQLMALKELFILSTQHGGQKYKYARWLYNRIFIILSWCYKKNSDNHREIARGLITENERSPHYSSMYSIGRCLVRPSDLELLFNEATRRLPRPYDIQHPTKWLKPLSEVLSFREDAWKFLDDNQAFTLAQSVNTVLGTESRKNSYKQKFYLAILLLVALLRFRQKAPDFLEKSHPLAAEIKSILEKSMSNIDAYKKLATIRQAIEFFEGRGRNMLILGELMEAADEE